jgi:hypothetical protein
MAFALNRPILGSCPCPLPTAAHLAPIYAHRFMDLIQKASVAPAAETAPATHNTPRPATIQGCFTTKHQQQQQQQLKRLSMTSDADSALAGISTSSSSAWLYTTTTSAATAAANKWRPQSSPRPRAKHIAAAAACAKAQALRPGSAAAPGPAVNLIQGFGAAQNPKAGAASGTASHPPLGSNLKGPGRQSVNITTSQAMHGLKDLYPDLWASTVPICRPDPAPNKNFISEWGESLRQGAGEAWKPYLATTSQLANLQVAKPVSTYAHLLNLNSLLSRTPAASALKASTHGSRALLLPTDEAHWIMC